MGKELKLPFYAKASFFFIGMFAFIYMLYIAKGLIVPLIFSIIIAIVLHPLVNFLVRVRINRVLAIAITLILSVVLIGALGTFIFSQASHFSESWPKLVEKFNVYTNETITWASGYFDISPQKIITWIENAKSDLFNSSGTAIGQTLVNVGNRFVVMLLIPVYVFMILFYQPLLIEFIRRVFGADNRTEVSQVISEVKKLIQSYLSGLVVEAIIVAILDTSALLILGIDYAILLGILGALLNVIPYIGGIIAVALPMMIALVTKTSLWYPFYVMAAYYFIQLIDNNFIVPKIVASKVKINALVSIIVVLAFGALWGIPGMFISIPLTAIIKLIFDHIEPLRPWGFLLGDTMPDLTLFKIKLKKK